MLDKKYNNPLYEKLKAYLFLEDDDKLKGHIRSDSVNKIESILHEQSSILHQDFKYLENKYHSVKHKKGKPNLIFNKEVK